MFITSRSVEKYTGIYVKLDICFSLLGKAFLFLLLLFSRPSLLLLDSLLDNARQVEEKVSQEVEGKEEEDEAGFKVDQVFLHALQDLLRRALRNEIFLILPFK